MNRKTIRITLLTLLILASIFFVFESDILPGLSTQRSTRGILWILQEVVKHIQEDYLEKADPSRTMEGAFKGLVNSLDEFSTYLPKEAVTKHLLNQDNTLLDVGIVLYKKFRTFPVVVGLRDSSPAAEQGIKIGDTVSTIEGKSALMMSMYEANLSLKGQTKGPVRIRILGANENREVRIERKRFSDKSYTYSEEEGTSGILSIHRLDPPCVQEIRESVLPRLKPQSLPLVIDLRNCHEGDFEEMQKFVNLFLQSSNVGYFAQKGGKKEVLACSSQPELPDLSLLIWTNQATMGPAEAAAAALKEYRKAKILGFRTPGLVAKQNFISLEDGSGLILTSAIFHLNAKKKIWGQGVEPDVKMEGLDQDRDSFLKETHKILSDI